MASKTATKVTIGGKTYTLSGNESEAYLQEVAAYLNEKIAQLRSDEDYRTVPMDMRNVLLQLNLADDYFKAKTQAPAKQTVPQDVFLTDAVEKLTHLLGTQVKIHPGKKKSKIEIEFYSADDLERIMGTILERQQDVKQQRIDALRKVSLSQKFTV